MVSCFERAESSLKTTKTFKDLFQVRNSQIIAYTESALEGELGGKSGRIAHST
jgi:hypothetical protein